MLFFQKKGKIPERILTVSSPQLVDFLNFILSVSENSNIDNSGVGEPLLKAIAKYKTNPNI